MRDSDPPPGSSTEFPWFERTQVVVVEGEVLASTYEQPGPGHDALLPPRSGC
ncbi:hypothetical protein [Saccharopolyspora mangrovi]|uniref:Uncharacterized protein n=1 Tax=Saccharopolyspora mangrovi TaxID=3082379 RepID=A0ABU6AC05_9PSEU|nr:hypothetical protein [Saccharopolyspora sp. S2-29]MEB3369056.1 hypothetical protein [Saccharopolyspora sp. S2-29]